MRRSLLKILVALLTFTFGVSAAFCFLYSESVLKKFSLNEFIEIEKNKIKIFPTPSESFIKGKSEAEQDLSKGKLKVVTIGTEMLYGKIYREILLNEYEIEVRNLGCLISDKDREFADGYNQISEIAIEQRYGKGVLKNVEQRATEETDRFFEDLKK